MGTTFEDWKAEVDTRVFSRVGRETSNLKDMDYQLHYEEGATPIQMENRLLSTVMVDELL